MKEIRRSTESLIIFICVFCLGKSCSKDNSDQIKELQIRCHFLEGYKDAYMNHIELCDTIHQKCFKIN